jgi:hypothetical protein
MAAMGTPAPRQARPGGGDRGGAGGGVEMSLFPTRLRVTLTIGSATLEAAVDLDEHFVANELCEPLKVSDGPFCMFDTPQRILRRVLYTREKFIERITPELVKVLGDVFASKDTINGYTHAETREFMEGLTGSGERG